MFDEVEKSIKNPPFSLFFNKPPRALEGQEKSPSSRGRGCIKGAKRRYEFSVQQEVFQYNGACNCLSPI